VSCALSVQRSSVSTPGHGASQPTIVLRIGINLGDVIIEGDDIYGDDGVNIAARLEPLAEPGGICVSSIVNESVGNRIDVRFQDSGEISVKNIDRPIRVWKWHPGAMTATAARSNAAKPEASVAAASIAVLPFTNMSGDPEQEYFSDGVSEDIITDLSKIAGLTVIARNSSFTYKGRSVDVRTIGRDLGVRSVLEGSIRRAGNRVRITAQLIDAATGAHLWADRYDRDLTDIFEAFDSEPGFGRGRPDQFDHGKPVGKRSAAPVLRNVAEQSVLDLVPLRCAWRIVVDADHEASVVGQLLQFALPEPHPRAIRAAAVGGDRELARMRIALSSHAFEPAADRLHGELGGVARDPDADEAGIGGHIVHPIGHDLAELLILEVVDVHAQWGAFRTIIGSAILEVANQLLLLGVDGDDGLLLSLRRNDFRVDIFELGVAVGMLGAFIRLAIGLA
jgi:TolB-like protein